MKALIVIPTYNERENITDILGDILRAAPHADVLVIDDNSPDGTGRLADELAADEPRIHVLHRPGKLGLGTAYIAGFRYAIARGYDLVFEMDADYSHDPSYLPSFFTAIENADLVIGSRYVRGGGTPNWSALRKFISGGGNVFARAVLGIPIHDCTAGFRCYRTAALRTLDLERIHTQGYAFQVEMAYLFWKRGFRVREVPIIFVDRRVGKSKMSRSIFIEGFVWVVRTRLFGDPALRAVPADSTVATAAHAAATEADAPSASTAGTSRP